ncbi:hypothetical protein B0J11DRAFT_602225 [Dendryphion nanum]|uniref:Uncharacterized protein n=1 Tax=Dendryphion nanum TaxID=256645 RepID=A0A9P9ISZ6_9PLEO|nr:hypothetical protein B0J11DRAFT_602225 [Dendryphion nanum]
MKSSFITLLSFLANIAVTSASPFNFEKRQCSCNPLPTPSQCSTSFRYQEPGFAPPGNFKAFKFDDCTAQLSLDKDQYISVIWAFEATYADGSRTEHKPIRDFDTFGVSDPMYPYLGNNFITRYPGNSAFTAIHEFTNVCKGGQAPISWRFLITSPDCFNSGQIPAVDGASRPAKVSGVSIRRVNDAGDFDVSWSAVPRAAAYSVIVQYPVGRDEIGNPYLNVRGARVQATTARIPTTAKSQHVIRSVIVHAVDSRGLWSLTTGVRQVDASW